MRVLVVTSWFPTEDEPHKVPFMVNDCQMIAADNDVLILHLDPNAARDTQGIPQIHTRPDGLRILSVPCKPNNIADAWRAAQAVVKASSKADLTHTMAFYSLLPVTLAHLLSSATAKVPWVHTEHFSEVARPSSWRAWISTKVLGGMFALPQQAVAVGKPLATQINKYRLLPGRPKARIIPNLVRAPKEPPKAQKHRWQRSDFDGTLHLVFIGNLIKHKGPDLAIEAVANLAVRNIDATLTLYGVGPEQSALEHLAADLGVSDKIRFAGFVPPEQLHQELPSYDMLISPTTLETFGIAVAEGLSHGMPVVVTGEGEHLQMVEVDNGVVAARTSEAIAEAIEDLLTCQTLASPKQISAKLSGKYGAETRLDQYRKVYREAR